MRSLEPLAARRGEREASVARRLSEAEDDCSQVVRAARGGLRPSAERQTKSGNRRRRDRRREGRCRIEGGATCGRVIRIVEIEDVVALGARGERIPRMRKAPALMAATGAVGKNNVKVAILRDDGDGVRMGASVERKHQRARKRSRRGRGLHRGAREQEERSQPPRSREPHGSTSSAAPLTRPACQSCSDAQLRGRTNGWPWVVSACWLRSAADPEQAARASDAGEVDRGMPAPG